VAVACCGDRLRGAVVPRRPEAPLGLAAILVW
jgi:hypothetical protein